MIGKLFGLGVFVICALSISAQQTAILEGKVYNFENKEILAFANIVLDDSIVISTDEFGYFSKELTPGYYKLNCSYIGFQTKAMYQTLVEPNQQNKLELYLKPTSSNIDQVNIIAETFQRTAESPVSVRKIGLSEIQRIAGSILDISKTIKTLPGVLPRVSFGYNIIVRGGASSENRYYLDGIEIPSINHFSVQGASGGPNGLINVDLLQSAKLHSGAFPTNRANALSSVLDMQMKSGRSDRLGGKLTLGATDYGISLEGPISDKTTFLISARNSYSQYLLKAIGLPIIPYYQDYMFKVKYKWNEKNELSLIGLGAKDKSRLNFDAEETDALLYNIGYIPEGDQWLYTAGLHYKHYLENSHYSFILSHNAFDNKAEKYFNNTYDPADLALQYHSREADIKSRMEHNIFRNGFNWKYGFSLDRTAFNLDNYNVSVNKEIESDTFDFSSNHSYFKYGAYISASKNYFNQKLNIYTGIRIDGNSYASQMQNPLDQISPRLSLSYNWNSKWVSSLSIGNYYQLPSPILMGYSRDGSLLNQDHLEYISGSQITLGQRMHPNSNWMISAEVFYKSYNDYPFLLKDSISFANANANYVVIGDQAAVSDSKGRAYGFEFYAKKKLTKRNYWSLSYSWIVSEFDNADEVFIPSSWDSRNSLALLTGFVLNNNWEMGLKFIYGSTTPYTPYDVEQSAIIQHWDVINRGVFDYNQLNTQHLPSFYQLDFRVDKDFYFNNWNLNAYIDIQNISSASVDLLPYLTVVRDENGAPLTDPNNPDRYLLKKIESDSGRILPTIGLIVEF